MSSFYYSDIATGHGAAGNTADVLNWWTDAGFSIAAGSVPISTDTIVTMQGTANAGTVAGTVTTIGTCAVSAAVIFSGNVSSFGTATISGGTFNGTVTTSAGNFTQSGGTFNAAYTGASATATVIGGTWNSTAAIKRLVNTACVFNGTVTLTSSGNLGAGVQTFSSVSVGSGCLISGGTHNGTVTNGSGQISGGIFNGSVSSSNTTGGTFNGPFTDSGSGGFEAINCVFNGTYTATAYVDYNNDGVGSNTFNSSATYSAGCSVAPLVTGNIYNGSISFGDSVFFSSKGEVMPQTISATISATNSLVASSSIVMLSGNRAMSLRVAAPSDADATFEIWGLSDSSDSTGQVIASQGAIAAADLAGGKGNPSNGWAAVPKGTTRRFVVPLPGPFYAYVIKASHNNSDNVARNVAFKGSI